MSWVEARAAGEQQLKRGTEARPAHPGGGIHPHPARFMEYRCSQIHGNIVRIEGDRPVSDVSSTHFPLGRFRSVFPVLAVPCFELLPRLL